MDPNPFSFNKVSDILFKDLNLHPISVCSIFWVSMGLILPKNKEKTDIQFQCYMSSTVFSVADKNYFYICFNMLENGKLKIIQPLGTFFLNGFGLFNLLLNGNLVLIWKKFDWLIQQIIRMNLFFRVWLISLKNCIFPPMKDKYLFMVFLFIYKSELETLLVYFTKDL